MTHPRIFTPSEVGKFRATKRRVFFEGAFGRRIGTFVLLGLFLFTGASANAIPQCKVLLKKVFVSKGPILLSTLRDGIQSGEIPITLQFSSDRHLLIDALNGANNAKIRAFAHLNHRSIGKQNPEVGAFLKALSNSRNEEAKFSRRADGSVALLWYPQYPDGELPSYTHVKLAVEGKVWGTMGVYEKLHSLEGHERLSKKALKKSFFQFDIQTNQEEIARLHYILEHNDRRGTGVGMCIQGACTALRRSGIANIPFPFDQIPSLAAAYLTIRSRIPKLKTITLRYRGKNALKSLFSADIIVDGIPVAFFGMAAVSILHPENEQRQSASKSLRYQSGK